MTANAAALWASRRVGAGSPLHQVGPTVTDKTNVQGRNSATAASGLVSETPRPDQVHPELLFQASCLGLLLDSAFLHRLVGLLDENLRDGRVHGGKVDLCHIAV